MELKSKVSVVTIIFNLRKAGRINSFIQCLKSVHNQTYKNIEHIVVDGNSTDGTMDVVRKYAAKGWIKYISEPDKGLYDAMNKGARMATGDYVAFLNSDDFWHDPRGVEWTVEALENSGAVFSFAPSYVLDREFPVHKVFTSIGSALMRMPFCHQTMFARRDAFLYMGGFNIKSYRSAADYNLILRMLTVGYPFVFVPHCFTSYRHGGYSATATGISNVECVKSIFEVYSAMMPEFTMQDAEKMFREHIVPNRLLEIVMPKLCPAMQAAVKELPAEPADGSCTKFNLYEYSYPVRPEELDPDTDWLMSRTTVKYFGIPVIRTLHTTGGMKVKLFGIPVWSKRKVL